MARTIGLNAQANRDLAIGWRALDVFLAIRRRLPGAPARLRGYILMAPAVVLVGVLVTGLVMLAVRSFHSFDPFIYREGALSLDNYSQLVENSLFRRVFVRTTIMAAITTVIATLLALPIAYTMVRTRSRAVRLVLLTAIFVPVATGDIARAYGWLVLFGRNGLVPSIADYLGLGQPEMLGTLWAVGQGTIQLQLPLCVLVLLPALYRVNPELEQVALSMGARPHTVWRRIILPLVRPGLAGAAAIAFIIGMGDFANPALLGQGRRDYVANLIGETVLQQNNQWLGSAMGSLVVSVVVSLGVVGPRYRTVLAASAPRKEHKR
jgi:putative spermidine/putrescine transport system permease protein